MPKTREAIANFFEHVRQKGYNASDLLDRYSYDMEIQINVARGQGELVADKRSTYSDGVMEWWNIRIPKNAMSEPEWKDYSMRWSLAQHAEAIGMTGWDWANRRSRWVAFDVDSITGHAKGVGIEDEELEKVKQKAFDIPWVELRRSTGGKGFHIYVYFDDEGIPTENHTVHAALARAILGMMSTYAGFDFATAVDVCGGNMWVWHRKVNSENEGLKIIKPATVELSLTGPEATRLPDNWRDHLAVVRRKANKIRVRGVAEADQTPFEALSHSRSIVPLDDTHKEIIDLLIHSGFSTIWNSDHWLLQTHTAGLKKLMDDDGGVKWKGFFDTISEGKNPDQPNCFMFPLRGGGWKVFRFHPGVPEHVTWNQDGGGWTCAFFNREPDLSLAATAMGGSEEEQENSFVFDTLSAARKAAAAIGCDIQLPSSWNDRETKLKRSKSGRLVIWVRRKPNEGKPSGWTEKKEWWVKIYKVRTDRMNEELQWPEYENLIRNVDSVGNREIGWVMKNRQDVWIDKPFNSVKLVLAERGHSEAETKMILGQAVSNSWTEVNLPFQSEYPGNRQWNRNAPQIRHQSVEIPDDEEPICPHWWKILNHLGSDLDATLKEDPWAIRNGVSTGGQYLAMWIASMIRFPFDPLPYLFFHGPENSGKSIFHEAISLLITAGCVSADRALTNQNDFNGELANAILAYVEETDVTTAGASARNKMKDWVTSAILWIRRMRTDAYPQPNTLHWCQMSNSQDACLVSVGDTRITMMYVPDLVGEEIPKLGPNGLLARLSDEAPHFMKVIMDMTIPEPEGRLHIPMIATASKKKAEAAHRDALSEFLHENTKYCAGHLIPFAEFFDRFQKWLPEEERLVWNSRRTIARKLPSDIAQGKWGGTGQKHLGNISWDKNAEPVSRPLIVSKGRLKQPE